MNEKLRAALEQARTAGASLRDGALGLGPRLIGVEPMAQWSWRVEALIRAAYGDARADIWREWTDPQPGADGVEGRFIAAQLAKLDVLISRVDTALTRAYDEDAWLREDFGPETPMAIQRVLGREPIDRPRARR